MEHFEEGKNSEEAVVLLVLESLSRAELDRTEFVLFKAIVFLRSGIHSCLFQLYEIMTINIARNKFGVKKIVKVM